MAGTRPCLLWARYSMLQTVYRHRPLNHQAINLRLFATQKPSSLKPRPYSELNSNQKARNEPRPRPVLQSTSSASPEKQEPLVRTRSFGDAPPEPLTAEFRPREKPAKMWFLYARITFGVVLVGSIIYSILANPLHAEAPSIADRDSVSKRESGVTENSPMRLRMEALIKDKQNEIMTALQQLDPSHKFRIDTWSRPAGGGGISCVQQDGNVFEKAGVNTSIVYGTLPRPAINKMRVNHKALDPDAESLEFFAAGLSLVIHPKNPNAPTVHLNYRYFETMDNDGECNAWWFGGGTDLTPSYLYDEDAIHFHKSIKDACDKHDRTYYPRFKKWCDKYFHIPHRQESRGIGGIFFDDLDDEEKDQEQLFAFIKDCLGSFLPGYMPIVARRKDLPFGEREKEWQQVRRGRYVEFNLVHDRGTSFGLNTPSARVESILMSLPLTAKWMYMHEPEKGSREERLLNVLKQPVDWV